MAAVAVERAMNLNDTSNHLHPFFSKKRHDQTPTVPIQNDDNEQPSATDLETEQKEAPKKRAKRSKKHDANGQKTILQGFGIKPEVTIELSADSVPTEVTREAELDSDPNYGRRKRQKTVSPVPQMTAHIEQNLTNVVIPVSDGGLASLESNQQLQAEPSKNVEREGIAAIPRDEPTEDDVLLVEQISTTAAQIQCIPNVEDLPKSTKTMRLKGGKLASPKAVRNGRLGVQESFVVKINYTKLSSNAQELGNRIQNILNGELVHRISAPTRRTIEKLKSTGPPKSTHPFFLGKVMKKEAEGTSCETEVATSTKSPAQNVDITMPSPRKTSATTPGKLRAQRDAFRMPGSPSITSSASAFVERKKLKHTGDHPAWPSKDNAHVRGFETLMSLPFIDIGSVGFMEKSAKRKLELNAIEDKENIFQLQAETLRPRDTILRQPKRMVTTGAELQTMVSTRLTAAGKVTQEAGPATGLNLNPNAHPALREIFRGIESSLSPLDTFECETQAWTQKYSPNSAAQVLQKGKEAHVLRDWLQRCTISAVQTGSNRSTASSAISTSRAGKPGNERKKRKRKDEDDFIVDSDDEIDQKNELLPLSDSNRQSTEQRSLVRGGDDYTQSTPGTAVLLSGPHGSGKTAAVYAVARELGFEIFEINSASRRAGKDVLDKIGDMTENHLVQQVSKALTEDKPIVTGAKPEAIQIEQPDTPDPKQKSMASFFKAAPTGKKPASTTAKLLPKSIVKAKDESNRPKVLQKQSLILLEEVDILFEEDKQFWLTILTLAAHSKRPIIMTCNDEKYVPIESLAYHAILRFVPPPVDLAADYLLLLAAQEGHMLQRQSVESLYQTKGYDLRGSITELNFWCQMAVGDPTRGFNWMLDRYPPGIDIDDQGRTLRVASDNTFVSGMNVVSQDLVQCDEENLDAKESLWVQAWDDWQVEAIDQFQNVGQKDALVNDPSCKSSGLDMLELSAFTADLLSAGDICFGFGMRKPNKQYLDHSMPPLREKIRASHALELSGVPDVLQVEPVTDYTYLDKQMAVVSHLGLTQLVQDHRQISNGSSPSTVTNDIVRAVEMKMSSNEQSSLSRNDFSIALDPLGYDPDDTSLGMGTYIVASSFDREFRIITTDLAPYIRTIAREYQLREEERLRMSNLLSVGGRKRQTRAANAAMDGGRRSERRARYFELLRKMEFNVGHVLATGGEDWSSFMVDTWTSTNSVAEEEAIGIKSP